MERVSIRRRALKPSLVAKSPLSLDEAAPGCSRTTTGVGQAGHECKQLVITENFCWPRVMTDVVPVIRFSAFKC